MLEWIRRWFAPRKKIVRIAWADRSYSFGPSVMIGCSAYEENEAGPEADQIVHVDVTPYNVETNCEARD